MRQVFFAITRVWCRKSFPSLFEMTIKSLAFLKNNSNSCSFCLLRSCRYLSHFWDKIAIPIYLAKLTVNEWDSMGHWLTMLYWVLWFSMYFSEKPTLQHQLSVGACRENKRFNHEKKVIMAIKHLITNRMNDKNIQNVFTSYNGNLLYVLTGFCSGAWVIN